MKLSRLKKILALFAAIAAVCAGTCQASRAAEPELQVYVSQPWLSSMARFIVGTTIKIRPALAWSQSGELRNSNRPPKGAAVIALDPQDSARFGLSRGDAGLFLLYDNLPIEDSSRGMLPFNPSILPFLSQRMLKIFCEQNPSNYSFYQRRIAEFQSRLESAVEVGRSLLNDIQILDLTGCASPWLRAASGGTVRPPAELWNAWASSTRTPDLTLALREAESRKWWIVTDAWTPAPIKTRAASSARCVTIAPPEGDYDFFTYLHDIYLLIWSRAAAK